MRMESILREENLKVVHHSGDVAYKAVEHESNIHLLYGSLVERYKRNQIALHIHLLRSDHSPDACIMCQCCQVWTPGLEPFIKGVAHLTERECAEFSEQQSSVLIDVCEFVQDGEARCVGLPVVVRLNRLNECNCGGIDALHLASTLSTLEAVMCEADGEHILFVGSVFRSQNQFPDQIVKRGTQVLEAVTDNQPYFFGDGRFRLNCERRLIRGAACIWHELALVRVKVPLNLGFNKVQVRFCVSDFLPDAI